MKLLDPPENSWYDESRCCLTGTREDVIKRILDWSTSESDSSRLYWLYGVAGCGKSSVATSVAQELQRQKVLSFSFFCTRDGPERRRAVRIIRSLAYYLAKAIEPFRKILLRILGKDSSVLGWPTRNQIKALLVDPLEEISGSTSPEMIVIVLDALDECDENEIVSESLVKITELAPWIRLIVTSRPLQGIRESLESSGALMTAHDLFSTSAEEDILVYTKHRFEVDRNLATLRSVVTSEEIKELSRKASGLFIWIAVVCSFISQRKFGRPKLFRDILRSANMSDSEKQLDELYMQVLKDASGSDQIAANTDDVRLILGLIYVTSKNRPLPIEVLYAFRPNDYSGLQSEWEEMMRDFGSVLITDNRTRAIRVCHESFLDFLGDRSRSERFWASPKELEAMMTETCLRIMLSGLKFNICKMETSHLPNGSQDLRINEQIPGELQYSCLFWLEHLSRCMTGLASLDPFRETLRKLLCRETSLYWLEVLSLLSELREAVIILQSFTDMLQVRVL